MVWATPDIPRSNVQKCIKIATIRAKKLLLKAQNLHHMYNVEINNNTYQVLPESAAVHQGTMNNEAYTFEYTHKDANNLVVTQNGETYNVEIAQLDMDNKTVVLRINGRKYKTAISDQFDQLLKDLGLEGLTEKKITDLRSPMPGLVVDILVEEGQEVKKGDAVAVLEAMKMENILKSPVDVVIKSVNVNKGVAVEKNQVLITFE